MAKTLGLPADQSYKMMQSGVDFYSITPKSGEAPTVFVSKIANTTQGELKMVTEADQVIVPNRTLWTKPEKIDPLEMRK